MPSEPKAKGRESGVHKDVCMLSRPSSSSNSSRASSLCTFTSPPTLSAPALSFSTVIDADHRSLTQLVLALQSLLESSVTAVPTLHTLLWRLIRHDISEELVMRPAFARYMGVSGREAADEDRRDHARIKNELLSLFEKQHVGADGNVVVGLSRETDQRWLQRRLRRLGQEMAEHMRVESGEVLPRFERLVGQDVSVELGRKYLWSLVLTPDVEVCVQGECSERKRKKCFEDVLEYARADVDVFRRVWERLEEEARTGVDGGYVEGIVTREMEEIGLRVGTRSAVASHNEDERGRCKTRDTGVRIRGKL